MAAYSDIYIDQGASFFNTLTVTDEDGAVNLTSYLVRGSMRRSYIATTATNLAVLITDAAQGKISSALTPAQTAALKPGRYVFDVEMEHTGTGDVTRVVEGTAVVSPEVTK